MELLDKSLYTQNFTDNDLSALELKLYTFIKRNLSLNKRISEEKERMNGLISDIAHQIKTPLTNIIMYTDLILEDSQSNPSSVVKIRYQAEKLRFLFDALIKMSRCENGIITGNLHMERSNVKDLLANAISDVYSIAEEKDITILTSCDADLYAHFDKKWSSEAIVNVIENAIKYSPNGSSIQVTAKKHELFVQINITDNGTGISEEEQQNIWKRFYRGDNAGNVKGVGIGLYLVKQILASEHGFAKVKSKQGEGSTFSLYLPVNEINA
jgi:signal transduction histidine kinase